MASPPQRSQVFFSYSHKDKKWLELFQASLKPLIKANQLSVWDDSKIKAGDAWRDEIKQALASAKVAVLLVSTHFLNSDFIAEHELPPLLEAAQKEGLKILLVVLGHSLFEETELGSYQAVNNPSKPLAGMSLANREKEIVRICKEIKAAATMPEMAKAARRDDHSEELTPDREAPTPDLTDMGLPEMLWLVIAFLLEQLDFAAKVNLLANKEAMRIQQEMPGELALLWRLRLVRRSIDMTKLNEKANEETHLSINEIRQIVARDILDNLRYKSEYAEAVLKALPWLRFDQEVWLLERQRAQERAAKEVLDYVPRIDHVRIREKLQERLSKSKSESLQTGKQDWALEFLAISWLQAKESERQRKLEEIGQLSDEEFEYQLDFVFGSTR